MQTAVERKVPTAMFKFLRRVAAALAVPLVTAAAPPPALHAEAKAPAAAHPALWEITDPDTTIYLFGTIHVLPTGYQWRTAKFDQAVAASSQLVIETIVDLDHPQSFQADFLRLGLGQGLPPIVERVPPAKRETLRAAIARVGTPEAALDRMKTWAVAFELLGGTLNTVGLQGEEGPETILRKEFTAADKPIGELETNAEQLGYFDSLPESAQRELLEGSIEKPTNFKSEFDGMLGTWARGNVRAIAMTFNRDIASPALKQALLIHRNANWRAWVEQRMKQPGTIMIAVGAGHLAGPDSVIELLRHDGYQVRRIQ